MEGIGQSEASVIVRGVGGPIFFLPQFLLFLFRSQCKNLKPYDNPFQENLGEDTSCCSSSSCYHEKVKSTPRFLLGWEFDNRGRDTRFWDGFNCWWPGRSSGNIFFWVKIGKEDKS